MAEAVVAAIPRKLFKILCCISFLSVVCFGLPSRIYIGGLFDTEDREQELAFAAAVNYINNDPTILPNSTLHAHSRRLERDDSYKASMQVCDLLQVGVGALFGPQSEFTSMHVQSICDALEVPHVVCRWEYRLQRDDLSVNLYPHPKTLSKAYVQLLERWDWREFYFVYEESDGSIRLQDILKESELRKWTVKVFQLTNSTVYREIFWKVKRTIMPHKSTDDNFDHRIVLDVPRTSLYNVLKSAQQVGMMTERQSYIILSLDAHSIPMDDFQHGETNVTTLRLIQEDTVEFQNLLQDINKALSIAENYTPLTTLRTESVLMYEMVKLFATALEAMDVSKNVRAFPPVSCNDMNKGSDGTSLVNYMKSSEMTGLTGNVQFDAEGFRSLLSFDLLYLTEVGYEKIGIMLPDGTIDITRTLSQETEFTDLENKCYIVTTIKSEGFLVLKESPDKLTGNQRYEGYIIDLMDDLSQRLHFSYTIRLVGDGNYGKNNGTHWNGMIGEVMSGTADIAAADLTINQERESVVDFTMPFMNTGIAILFKKPTTKVTSLFSFLSPFSVEVWIYVMGAYATVTAVLFIVGRLSPYEWSNPHPCRSEDMVEENAFSLLNSMWFTIGSLMQQGSDVSPNSSSTRTLASMWYFFNLIMISSYTANLAAFLTVEEIVYPFKNVKELANQEKIKYGCKKGGSTQAFFENSTIQVYQKMWKFMAKHSDEVLIPDNELAKEKILEGSYAYFAEVSMIEYLVERKCNFTQIGGPLDTKAYGIGVKKGNRKLAAWLTGGILKMQEEGKLLTLKERWWKQKKGGGKCKEASKSSSSVNELGLGNVGGVFVVMLLGLSLSAVVAVLEFLWYSRKIDRPRKEPPYKMLLKELKFAVLCGSSEKIAPKLRTKEEKSSKS